MLVSSPKHYRWVPANATMFPQGAIVGGYENGRKLFICQASYQGGVHPGKVVGANCNFGFGGQEISASYYNVLVYV